MNEANFALLHAIIEYSIQQELSYPEQIARKLRTQYCVGTSRNPVSDVEIWVRGHLRSLKLVPFERSGAVSFHLL